MIAKWPGFWCLILAAILSGGFFVAAYSMLMEYRRWKNELVCCDRLFTFEGRYYAEPLWLPIGNFTMHSDGHVYAPRWQLVAAGVHDGRTWK